MSDNKLDFRKMKQTQFDSGQVLKGSFSELTSSLRTLQITPVLSDAYTHFIQTLDTEGRPVNVEYYQAVDPARDRINFAGDVGGSLAGKYFALQEFISKKVHVFWYEVSGVGTAPSIGDVKHKIVINTNDMASVVSFATKSKIKETQEFIVLGNNLLSAYVDIEYYQFGETQAVDLGTSGFLSSRIKQGSSLKVGEISLAYTIEGNPVYNGNVLTGLVYNAFKAEFEAVADVNVGNLTVNLAPLISKDPEILNLSLPLANTEYSISLPLGTKRFSASVRGDDTRFTVSYVSGGPVKTLLPGNSYEESGLLVDAASSTLYFTSTKDNKVIEIVTWK